MIKENPYFYPGYYHIAEIYKNLGNREGVKKIHDQLVEHETGISQVLESVTGLL